jgi:excisionase family DNA binding protein
MLDPETDNPCAPGRGACSNRKGEREMSRSPILEAIPGPCERQTSYNRRPANSRLLSTQQASAYLGVSPNTLRKYVGEGELKAYRLGDKLLKYDPVDLDKFLQGKAENA